MKKWKEWEDEILLLYHLRISSINFVVQTTERTKAACRSRLNTLRDSMRLRVYYCEAYKKVETLAFDAEELYSPYSGRRLSKVRNNLCEEELANEIMYSHGLYDGKTKVLKARDIYLRKTSLSDLVKNAYPSLVAENIFSKATAFMQPSSLLSNLANTPETVKWRQL